MGSTHFKLLMMMLPAGCCCRFHMQADFVLPSSREGILESRPWNMWLQQEVGMTLCMLG